MPWLSPCGHEKTFCFLWWIGHFSPLFGSIGRRLLLLSKVERSISDVPGFEAHQFWILGISLFSSPCKVPWMITSESLPFILWVFHLASGLLDLHQHFRTVNVYQAKGSRSFSSWIPTEFKRRWKKEWEKWWLGISSHCVWNLKLIFYCALYKISKKKNDSSFIEPYLIHLIRLVSMGIKKKSKGMCESSLRIGIAHLDL